VVALVQGMVDLGIVALVCGSMFGFAAYQLVANFEGIL
jgi:hypothetical protein